MSQQLILNSFCMSYEINSLIEKHFFITFLFLFTFTSIHLFPSARDQIKNFELARKRLYYCPMSSLSILHLCNVVTFLLQTIHSICSVILIGIVSLLFWQNHHWFIFHHLLQPSYDIIYCPTSCFKFLSPQLALN